MTIAPARIVHERSTSMPGTTACGRGDRPGRDGIAAGAAITDEPDEVTCKTCLRVRKLSASRAETAIPAPPTRWNRLRDHITGERAAQDQLAADHGELGHRDQEERAYGRVEALDGLLAMMERLEAGQ